MSHHRFISTWELRKDPTYGRERTAYGPWILRWWFFLDRPEPSRCAPALRPLLVTGHAIGVGCVWGWTGWRVPLRPPGAERPIPSLALSVDASRNFNLASTASMKVAGPLEGGFPLQLIRCDVAIV